MQPAMPYFPSARAPKPPAPVTLRDESRPSRLAARAFWPAAAALPGVVALAFGVRRGARPAVLAGAVAATVIGLVRWQLQRLFTEHASYVVEDRLGPVEIRRYAPRIVIETTIPHRTWDDALQEGFRRLARYLREEDLAMTAPVSVTLDGGGITIGFTAPHGATLLPEPSDPHVSLREVPASRVAALRYRGRYDDALAHDKQRELVSALSRAGIETRGEPSFAGYDPPTTIPLLRRVEACVEIA